VFKLTFKLDIDDTIYIFSWNENDSLTSLKYIFDRILHNACFLKPTKHIICKHPSLNVEQLKSLDIYQIKENHYTYFKFSVNWKYDCIIKKAWTLNPNEAVLNIERLIFKTELLKKMSKKELINYCRVCHPSIYASHCKSIMPSKVTIVKDILKIEVSSLECGHEYFKNLSTENNFKST
jgi:hypothetical protein